MNKKHLITSTELVQIPTTEEEEVGDVVDRWEIYINNDYQDGKGIQRTYAGEMVKWRNGCGAMRIGSMHFLLNRKEIEEKVNTLVKK